MKSGAAHTKAVTRHYASTPVLAKILSALRAAGRDLDHLTVDDLAPLDQLHSGGKDATFDLARLAGVSRKMQVLDVGGGLGGPARFLARETGCRVTVIDLTEEFCRGGEDLTARTGLAGQVRFWHASALEVPCRAASFDLAWTQHSTMNIEDKPALFRDLARVVRPGGRLAMHEILAGVNQPIRFPVPWARQPHTSFLLPPSQFRTLVADAGFTEIVWNDVSSAALHSGRERVQAMREHGLPPLGIHVVIGEDFPTMVSQVVTNLEEQRLVVIMGVWERRDSG